MSAAPGNGPVPKVGRAIAVYTGLRVLAFVGCYGVLLVLGFGGLLGIAAALLLSSTLSLFLMRGPRDRVTAALAARKLARDGERERLRSLLDKAPPA